MSINAISFDDDSVIGEAPIRNISRVAGLIKQRLDIVKAAIAYGFDYSRKEVNHPCPACSKTSKSRATLHLYDDRWHCFSCAVGGDVIDYIAHAEGFAKGKAIASLAARLGITDDSDGDVIDDAIDRFRTIIEDRKQASYDPPIMQTIDRAWNKIVRDREECQMRPEPAKMAGMFHRLECLSAKTGFDFVTKSFPIDTNLNWSRATDGGSTVGLGHHNAIASLQERYLSWLLDNAVLASPVRAGFDDDRQMADIMLSRYMSRKRIFGVSFRERFGHDYDKVRLFCPSDDINTPMRPFQVFGDAKQIFDQAENARQQINGSTPPLAMTRALADKLASRFVMPIMPISGRTAIGFAARDLDGDRSPKWWSTPNSLIYAKGSSFQWRSPQAMIRAAMHGLAIIVEGSMDAAAIEMAMLRRALRDRHKLRSPYPATRFDKRVVLDARRACPPVLAVGSSRITARQSEWLRRLKVSRAIILADGDAAGRLGATESAATLRGRAIVSTIIDMPDGQDPDEHPASSLAAIDEATRGDAPGLVREAYAAAISRELGFG